ncbi:MAG: DUF3291 domain-containing protein [Pseudomonadota bacterium]
MTRHLAQLNIGRTVADLDHPQLSGFMDNLDRLNALAERMPGFVWRMTGEGNNATDIKLEGDPRFISNLSVWETPQALATYVWGTVHRQFYERKGEWFEAMDEAHFVMWWVPVGHRPSVEEGTARLAHLRQYGPSDHAFGWESLRLSGRALPQTCSTLAAE